MGREAVSSVGRGRCHPMLNINSIIKLYSVPGIRIIVRRYLLNHGLDLPLSVRVGNGVEFPHNAIGTVVHPYTSLGDRVKIYQNVTIGRGDVWKPYNSNNNLFFKIDDGAILGAGCKIIASSGTLKVGRGTVIGANAVLLQSTGENEIWAGIPARKIGMRPS